MTAIGTEEYPEDEWLMLSGIEHFAFCKRRWALVHIEQQWDENYLTTSGTLEHERAHDYGESESRGDLLILRDLKIFSRKLGISGACDVVEFHQNDNGIELRKRKGRWIPYPIEYKHGKADINEGYAMQLCAEAMCLEEMLSCNIPKGALYYRQIHRRHEIEFDQQLRNKVASATREMHDYYSKGHTPMVKRRKNCKSCSLHELCPPQLMKKSAKQYIKDAIEQGKPS